MGTSTVLLLSDIHANSKVGICPPVVNLYKGGTYRATRPQMWLHSRMLELRDGTEREEVFASRFLAELYVAMIPFTVEPDGAHTVRAAILSPLLPA